MRKRGVGDAGNARFAQGEQHRMHARSAPVRQEEGALRPRDVRDVLLRARDDAAGRKQIIRIGKFGDIRPRALVPGGVKGEVRLFLRAQHLQDMAAGNALHAPYSSKR